MPAPSLSPEIARRYRSSGYWLGRTLWSFCSEGTERFGGREALVDGDTRLGFQELRARAERVAARLASLGVGHGTTVAVQLPNWWETVVVYWALIRLGAVLNPVLPIHRRREVEFILREGGAEVLFVPGVFRGFDHRALAEEIRPASPALRHVVVVRDEPAEGQRAFSAVAESGDALGPEVPGASEDLVLLMYTSGTTAEPKGVLHTHETLQYELRSLGVVHAIGPQDTVLMPSPLAHVSGLLHAALLPFVLGTRAVLMDSWDAGRALDVIERESVTYMVGAPVFLSDLAFHPTTALRPPKTLRLFSCGGAGVSAELVRESRRRLGCVAKRVYGSTEFPTLTTTGAEDSLERGVTTEGRPIWGAELRIADDEGNALPAGTEGEVLARGPECFVGYRKPELDDDAFTADGWFRTGDLGVVDDEGYLTIRGRKKDIIIRKGEKISATELESLIARHPAVAEVAVIALADAKSGERACACVELRGGLTLSLAELCDYLSQQGLARQKLPEAFAIVSAWPRTASGKVQKTRLRAMVEAMS